MKLIRYNDIVAKGIVNSRMTLKRLIELAKLPAGRPDHTKRAGVGRS